MPKLDISAICTRKCKCWSYCSDLPTSVGIDELFNTHVQITKCQLLMWYGLE